MRNSENHPEGSDPAEKQPEKLPEPTAGDLQAQALKYHEWGANVVALAPPEGDNKGRPLHKWTPWKETRQSEQFVRSRAWKDAAALSALCGPGGWRCLDFDSAATDAAVRKALGALGLPEDYRWAVRSGSGEGFHIWFRCTGELPTAALGEEGASEKQVRYDWPGKEGLNVDHVELRWWGLQTILPPSLHESGGRYRWRGERPEGPPAEVSAGHVVTAFFAVAEKPELEKEEKRSASAPAREGRAPRPASGNAGGPGRGLDKEALERQLAPSDRRRCFDALGFEIGSRSADASGYVGEVLGPKKLGEGGSPNFSLNLETGGIKDFGGGYTGDLYSAVQDVWCCTFPEALAWVAEQAGVDAQRTAGGGPSAPQSGGNAEAGGFTLDDFCEALRGLEGREAERKAADLIEKVATLPRPDIARAVEILDDTNDVRKRRLRSWHGTVKNEKKRLEEVAAAAKEDAAGELHELSGGELTAWIARQIEETDAFATDRSGALFFYKSGCYHPKGEKHLRARVKEVLEEAGVTKKFSDFRCREVLTWLEASRLPQLWEHPPKDRLCLKNGILNLNTLQLEEHGPAEWLSTVKIPIRYDPEANGSAWEEHFAAVLPEKAHAASVGFELFAKLFTPATAKEKAVLFHGPSNTGKSLTLDVMVKALGADESVTSCSLQELETNRFARGDLAGKVANVDADLPSAPLEGTAVFKKITGGDRIRGDRKHRDGFNFRPHCHMLFSSNHRLHVKPRDNAPWFWDRWLVLPFRAVFKKGSGGYEDRDRIEKRLLQGAELSALLNRALELHPGVEEDGVTETEEMRLALDRMKRPGNDEEETPRGSNPSGDGRRNGPPPVPSAPLAQQTADSNPAASLCESKSRTQGGCVRDRDSTQSCENPPGTPETPPAGKRPLEPAGDGHAGEAAGDGHGPPPPEGYPEGEPEDLDWNLGPALEELRAGISWMDEPDAPEKPEEGLQ